LVIIFVVCFAEVGVGPHGGRHKICSSIYGNN
jgi:hypothetical protein